MGSSLLEISIEKPSAVLYPQAASAVVAVEVPRLRVANTLRQWIRDGSLPVGRRLPAERRLSSQLNVDRSTVRRVLSELTDEGWLQQISPRARVVTSPAPAMMRSLMMTNTVAVVAPALDQLETVHEHGGWLEFISQGAMEAVQTAGLNTLRVHSKQLEAGGINHLVTDQPKGLIIPEAPSEYGMAPKLVAAARRGGLPVVVYGDGEGLTEVDRVVSDHEQGNYELTRWLISQNRKRIVCVYPRGSQEMYWVENRLAGYQRAMREAGLDILPPLLIPQVPEDDGNEQVFRDGAHHLAGFLVPWLTGANPVDGLMVVSDRETYTAAAACRLFGRIPHKDIGLVGYDNYWADCLAEQKFEPAGPQATVDKQNKYMGEEMVKLLLARVDGKLPQPPQCVKVKPQLIIVGGSGMASDGMESESCLVR